MDELISTLDLDTLHHGDRITVWTNDGMYMFVKNGDYLRLLVKESSLPDDLPEHIESNRNIQEICCNQDIDRDDMAVYVLPIVKQLRLHASLKLYAKATCAPWQDDHSRIFYSESVCGIRMAANHIAPHVLSAS